MSLTLLLNSSNIFSEELNRLETELNQLRSEIRPFIRTYTTNQTANDYKVRKWHFSVSKNIYRHSVFYDVNISALSTIGYYKHIPIPIQFVEVEYKSKEAKFLSDYARAYRAIELLPFPDFEEKSKEFDNTNNQLPEEEKIKNLKKEVAKLKRGITVLKGESVIVLDLSWFLPSGECLDSAENVYPKELSNDEIQVKPMCFKIERSSSNDFPIKGDSLSTKHDSSIALIISFSGKNKN